MAEKFNSFAALGKSLNRPEPTESWFEKEDKLLRSQLVQARHNHNKRFEIITLNKLGTLYRKNSNYDQAIAYFQQTLKLNKEDVFAFDGLGMVYFAMEQYDKAIEWFKKQLDPVVALNNLSRCYYRIGNYKQAIEYSKHVLEKNPTDKIAMGNLAIAYRKQKSYEQAIEWYKNSLTLDSKNKQAMDGLGITYREMGDYQQAIHWFQERLKIEPKDKQAMDGLGITYREMGDYEKSIEWFNKKLEFHPNDKHALNGLESNYAKMETNPQAISHFKHQLHLNHNDTEAQKYLETISDKLQDKGELKPAQEILNFLQEIVPNEFPIRQESLEEKNLRLEQEIKTQKANMLSSQKMSMVGAMTAGLSHEIMQPLQIILSTAQNCQLDVEGDVLDKSQIIDDLQQITTMTKRLDHIINHLHVFSRDRKPTPELVDVNTTIEDSLILLS